MPESRPPPYKYLPKPFRSLRVAFDDPLSENDIRVGVIECARRASGPTTVSPRGAHGTATIAPWIRDEWHRERHSPLDPNLDSMRSELTALIQSHVETLGKKVSSL